MPAIPASLDRRLRELRDSTVPLFDLPERQLAKRYRRGGWTARQVLIHIADIESGFLDRIRRVIAQDKPLLMALDPDAWTEHLDYATREMSTALALFLASRATSIELLAAHRADAGRTGVHSETGLVTLEQLADRVAWHNEHHLEQVRQAVS